MSRIELNYLLLLLEGHPLVLTHNPAAFSCCCFSDWLPGSLLSIGQDSTEFHLVSLEAVNCVNLIIQWEADAIRAHTNKCNANSVEEFSMPLTYANVWLVNPENKRELA